MKAKKKELLWEEQKYQKFEQIQVNLELLKWSTKYFLIENFLGLTKSDRVLDIGCGYGTTLFLVSSAIKSGVGIDVSKTAIQKAKKISQILKSNNLTFETGDANKIDFPMRNFDKIICFDVAEHLVEPDNLFREIGRLLLPGGKALVYTNFNGKFCWGFVKEFLKKRGRIGNLWTRDQSVLHLNRFTKKQLDGYLKKRKLKYSLVFKNHWLTPMILDLTGILQKLNSKSNDQKKIRRKLIKFDTKVPFVSKIQYFLSTWEMRIFGRLPSEGVFILIEKEHK